MSLHLVETIVPLPYFSLAHR